MNMAVSPSNFNGLVSESLRTTSRVIAEKFEKRHDHVVRDIRNLIEANPDWGFPNFGETPYVDPQNGQTYQMYEMTRDGYSMLVMGFTGKKALDWKIKFLDAFNMMEQRVKSPAILSGPQLMAAALIEADATMRVQAQQIEAMRGDVTAFERIAKADGSLCFRDAAKSLQVRPIDLTRVLQSNRWIYRQSQNGPWIGYQDKVSTGYLEHKVTMVDRADGVTQAVTQCRVTPKGMVRLAKLIGGAA